MPEDVTATQVVTSDGGAPLGIPNPGASPAEPQEAAAQESASPPPAAKPEPKVLTIPTSAMRREKEEAFNKGKQAALEELMAGAGVASAADLFSALQKARGATAAQSQPAQKAPDAADETGDDPAKTLAASKEARREEGKYQRQLEKTLTERNKYAQSAQQWQQRAREAQAEVDAVRAEMHLRTLAAQCSVTDVDYALVLFTREVEKLTPEQAEKFDERSFFQGLRKTHPYLYGETVVPATTGTGAGGAPTPPKPAMVAAQNGTNGKFDARKATPQQLREELAKRGLVQGM